MCSFNYNEIILLNNLIYLEWDVKDNTNLYELVNNILEDQNLKILLEKMKNCIVTMTEKEWRDILNLILNNHDLKDVIVNNLKNSKTGMRVACFIKDKDVLVVFRGTTTVKEWEDNGQGVYEYDTDQQIFAFDYINSLDYDNVTVSGHSKGGNKAQYTTIRCPKVKKCISINGQGFSNEFIKKYDKNIENNKNKIISINAKYDYVSCLLNSICGERHYIKTEFQINPLYYHKCNILLDNSGKLREETDMCIFTKILNDFSTSIISDLPQDIKYLTADGIISGLESFLCKDGNVEKILKALGGILVLLTYGRYFQIKEYLALTYTVLEILLIPLFLWKDMIDIDESKSKESFDIVLSKIEVLSKMFLEKLKLIEGKKHNIYDKTEKNINKFLGKLKELSTSLI